MNWAMKGFTTEREPRQNRNIEESQIAHEETTPEPVAPKTPTEQASAVLFNFQGPQGQYNTGYNPAPQFNGALQGATLGNRHILVMTPRTDNEVFTIVDHLKTNEAVIVNFEGIPAVETQRRIDFLSGVACGLGGAIRPLDKNKFI